MTQASHNSLAAEPPDISGPGSACDSSRRAGTGWLSVGEAAAVLGISRRAAQLRCQRGQLTAAQVEGHWYVDPESTPALRIATGDFSPAPTPVGSPLASLTARQRQRLYHRYEMLTSYLGALEHKPASLSKLEFTIAWVETWNLHHTKQRTSRTALLRWVSLHSDKGIAGLIDRRGGYRNGAAFAPEVKEYLKGLYVKESRPSIPYIYTLGKHYARERGLDIPSLRTVQTWFRTKVDPKFLAAGRDPRQFRDRCLPYVKRDWSLVPAMHCWIGDHRLLDVWLPRRIVKTIDGRKQEVTTWQRPWLTCFMDARSWLPVGSIIDFDHPNAQRVASAFIQAVEKHGCPEHAILDNGKDFRAHEVAGGRSRRHRQKLFDERHTDPIMQSLGVTVHWAVPYNARAKTIERFFGILAAQFDKSWPTYCGNSPENTPEQLKGLKASEVDPNLNLATFRAAFDRWVEQDYALQPSPAAAAAGLSVMRAFHELRAPDFQPVRPSVAELAMLLTRGKRVRIDRNGLYVHAFGQFYSCDDPEFERRRAASGRDIDRHVVYRFADGDPAKVFVFDARTDRFLFIATPYIGTAIHPLTGCNAAGEPALDQAIALQRRLARETNEQVRDLKQAASNVLLEAHRRAGNELGILDDPASITTARPPIVKLVGTGELARAAMAAQKHQKRELARQDQEAAAALFATGTDDHQAVRQPPVDPLSQLADEIEETTNERPHNPPSTA